MQTPKSEGVVIPAEEVAMAFEAAILQVRQFHAEGQLAVRDRVVYRSPGGEIHPGPLVVVSLEARTALVEGFMKGNSEPIQLRVGRNELTRMADIGGIVQRILSEAHSCPHCTGQDPSRPAGQNQRTPRTDN